MMTVRLYEASDKQPVVALWAMVFGSPADHNSPQSSLDRKVEFGDELLFVTTDGKDIVGTVMGGYDGHRGWVYSLAVHPESRRKGVATNLMRHLEAHLEELGCPKLNLQVRATNHEVLPFYKGLGYTIEERTSMGNRLNSSL